MSRITKDNDVSESQTEDDIVKNAVTNAVHSCIEEEIMKGYLEEHAEEVIETLMLQWDNELAMQARFEEGQKEGIEFVAVNMIRDGEPLDKILKFTNLSLERIQELARSLTK